MKRSFFYSIICLLFLTASASYAYTYSCWSCSSHFGNNSFSTLLSDERQTNYPVPPKTCTELLKEVGAEVGSYINDYKSSVEGSGGFCYLPASFFPGVKSQSQPPLSCYKTDVSPNKNGECPQQ